ncbi:C4-dicarboxylate ABC transporter substrate-binding protein [candidate division KSB3 bacterium]|uniref:C4-dicarboxylate ABC transporter substrate-binding protein n=1 Tax=candidate division KSB3 bacterium TaxID=2044937 RepID=A0A2G6E2B3_9BACT|nr:MAG: C4-dicarboxylate ABC transporter substrate-binding protein [candidate division KSB3 bacterium]PIE28728.1 MAG: C4-dicarboxylate ABC transporter substrate-binding protein [candidate division KSB3 bacterium]
MKKMLCFIIVCLFISTGINHASAQRPDQLKFVAGPPGGTWFSMGGTISDVMTKEVIPTTSSTGGGVSNVVNISRGKADLGLSAAVLGTPAKTGETPFKSPLPNSMRLGNLYKQYLYVVIRKDYAQEHKVTTLGDIFRQKLPIRMAMLKPGTVSEFVVRQTLAAYDVSYDQIKEWGGKIEFASYSDGSNLLADNHIDAFAFTVSSPASIVLKIETQVDIEILPTDQDVLDKMKERMGTTTHNIPKGMYKCAVEDIPVVGDYTVILIRGDLPDELVYEMTKALFENKTTLAQSIKALEALNPQDAAAENAFVLHPGALKYYKEIGAVQ